MASFMESPGPSLMRSISVDSTRDPAVYLGISDRTRGWKSRRFGDLMEGRIPPSANIKRWDGAAKACAAWDCLRRVSSISDETWQTLSNAVTRTRSYGSAMAIALYISTEKDNHGEGQHSKYH
jgi:hypothetical protein